MNYNFNPMVDWEKQKAAFLLQTAISLGMDVNGYGELSVNTTSGYTYLWLEDYSFTLYMPINCDLQKSDIYAMYTDFETGEEIETSIDGMNLYAIEEWVEDIQKDIETRNEESLNSHL